MADPNPLLGFAKGDENAARHLQDRFRIIQERSPDPHIRALAGKVLRGEASPREALRDPAFGKFLASSVQTGMRRIKALSEEERQKLAEQGEREYRDIGLNTAEPARERPQRKPVQEPPDDDDVAFAEFNANPLEEVE